MNRQKALGVLLVGSSLLISASFGTWAEKMGEEKDPWIQCMPVSSDGTIFYCIGVKSQGVEMFYAKQISEKEMECGSDVRCVIQLLEGARDNQLKEK